jgi:MarR family 2-MHQ and catechol resistance regulon transcriptional repressor
MNELPPDQITVQLLGALGNVAGRLDAALEPIGLSLPKYRLLSQLAAAGEPLPLRTLADHSSCVRSNITQLVDRLEADGLVVRVQDPRDRRSIRAELTPAGYERQVAGRKALEIAEQALLSRLPAADREALMVLLGRLQGA